MEIRKKIIGSLLLILAFGICLIIGYNFSKVNSDNKGSDIFVEDKKIAATQDNTTKETAGASEDTYKKIHVYVRGAVKKQSPYSIEISAGSLYEDAIKQAGGPSDEADLDSPLYTPQKKLKDEDIVYVPRKGENISGNNSVSSISQSNPSSKLNINSATEEEIVAKKISRIGKATAAKIVKYRNEHGNIKDIEDLKKAIGPKTAENMADYISFN
ncbi:MAG: helix-hairpin-helix domain-containing protein [Bacillota bacterium]|nr:helix-hairpin-helix domain-containing protein [Bacillota bacterium]